MSEEPRVQPVRISAERVPLCPKCDTRMMYKQVTTEFGACHWMVAGWMLHPGVKSTTTTYYCPRCDWQSGLIVAEGGF